MTVCVSAAACGGDGITPPTASEDTDTVVHSIAVSPSQRTVGVLGVQFAVGASALTEDGDRLYGTTSDPSRFSWSSSAPDVATIDDAPSHPDGRRCCVVTARSEGTATITATSHGLSDSMTVTVHDRARLAWSTPVPGVVQADIAIGADGTIYAGVTDFPTYRTLWHALSPDGEVLWTLDLPRTDRSAPAIGTDGTLYVGSWSDHGFASSLIAVAPDGTVRWTLDGLDAITSSPAIGPDGNIYAAGHRHVYAVDPQGEIQWTYEHDDDVFYSSSPAIASDGTIYVGGHDHLLHAISPDGSPLWTFRTDDLIQSSPAIGPDGTVYVGSDDGRLYAVHPDGTEQWRVDVHPFSVTSSPSIGPDGTIYVGGEGPFAIDRDGSIRWNWDVGASKVSNTPILGANGNVYWAAGGGVAAVNADGELLWDFTAGGHIASPAIAPDGRIIVSSFTAEEGGSVVAIVETNPNGGYSASPWPTGRGDRANSGRASG